MSHTFVLGKSGPYKDPFIMHRKFWTETIIPLVYRY